MCAGCFSEWDDENSDPRVSQGKCPNRGTSLKADDGSNGARRYGYCKQFKGIGKLRLCLQSQHRKRQFVRLSQFSAADIRQVLEKVRNVIDLGDIYLKSNPISCAGVISDTTAQEFAAKFARIEQRTRETYPHETWELPVMYVQAGELSTAEFSCLWQRGVVVVVRGLLSALNSEIWQPEWWIENLGDEVVDIPDCADGAKPVGRRSPSILSVGQFNLVNRLPAEFVPPDLGPKMYCAYGSSDGEGGVGTTNLHCNMADAVNIMAYAPGIWIRSDDGSSAPPAASNTDAPAAAAVWDIYPPEAMSDLCKFIGKSVGISYSAECSEPVTAKLGDPIHNQETFLTRPMRKQFFERYGHSCYRIYQIPDDAVFVPAGCAYQVCNYASAVKIAMDFVSPERVEHSRRLTEEFRQLNNKHPRNRDLLQFGYILWWTFAGEEPPPNQPELSDLDSEDESAETTDKVW
ncbi:hypothetical protein GGI17_001236 [Coemansia sp. S146]|nr:hypothetical protein GGI17_001236 [Coemansia sp. S146]